MFLSSGFDIRFESLHKLLQATYDKMILRCDDMAAFAAGLAGLGALLYIAYRVWQSLARAEPIDVFPLLRPFFIGLCILFFRDIVITPLNGILSPLVVGTNQMLQEELMDMKELERKRDQLQFESTVSRATLGIIEPNEYYDKQLRELGLDVTSQGILDAVYDTYNALTLKSITLNIMRWLFEFLFSAAALIIDTLRTFYLIILTILGPLAFAISVFDGFQATLTHWLARYISIYLWLPIADLFSTMIAKIQNLSIDRDIELIGSNSFLPDTHNSVYLIFMLIGIVGYFTIPSVATWIVQTSGVGSYNRKINSMASTATNVAAAAAGASTGNVSGSLVGNAK